MAVGFEGANTLVRLWDNKIKWMQNPYSLEWTVGGCYALGPGVYVGNNIKNDPDVVILRPLGHYCSHTKKELFEGDIVLIRPSFKFIEPYHIVCKLNSQTFKLLENKDIRVELVGNVFEHAHIIENSKPAPNIPFP